MSPFNQLRVFAEQDGSGLRKLDKAALGKLLGHAKCNIVEDVETMSNEIVDCYLLFESNMFVFPCKIIIKTCGTTTMLKLVPYLIDDAKKFSLVVKGVTYTRGSFMFPNMQVEPHRSFHDEIKVLNQYFGELGSANRHSLVLGNCPGKQWHLYTCGNANDELTLAVCMTGIAPGKVAVFSTKKFQTAKEMTAYFGVSKIFPDSKISELTFEPFGYNMNSLRDSTISTIHVTPQLDFSFASIESHGHDLTIARIIHLLQRVLVSFSPREFSLAVYGRVRLQSNSLNVDVEYYTRRSSTSRDLGGGVGVLFYNFCGLKTRL